MFEIREIIDLAIQIEKNAEEIYRNALQLAQDPSVYALLQKLANEEVRHEEWFRKLGREVKSIQDDPQMAELGKTILRGILGDQAFSLREIDFSRIRHVNDVLEIAIEFEQDTIRFYEMLRSMMDDSDTLEQLNKIIQEEKQHVQLFQQILSTGDFDAERL